MAVDVKSEKEVESRMTVIRRRLEFEKDPDAFKESFAEQQEELAKRILESKERMKDIDIGDDALRMAVDASLYFGVDGHRADITLLKAASAHAAFYGRTSVIKEDVASIANLVLTHRMRRNPFQESTIDSKELSKWIDSV